MREYLNQLASAVVEVSDSPTLSEQSKTLLLDLICKEVEDVKHDAELLFREFPEDDRELSRAS